MIVPVVAGPFSGGVGVTMGSRQNPGRFITLYITSKCIYRVLLIKSVVTYFVYVNVTYICIDLHRNVHKLALSLSVPRVHLP